jgi:acyl carrier protein
MKRMPGYLRILRLRPAQAQQLAVARAELDDDCVAQAGPLAVIEQHDPAVLRRTFPCPGARNVHHVKVFEAAAARERLRPPARFDGEDATRRARWIFHPAQRDEQDRAKQKPHGVDPRKEAPEHAAIIRGVTRDEIAEKLIAIVRQEKNVSEELLTPSTALADAGIDSLDSLTILFAIEEHFKISIPDDRARAIRTFGDMIDVVQDLQKQ